ncbi:MAG: hypothetical protein KC766_16825 [Myxococcales bacterium]|nr:hypothetical protein [Myxococcales bacterium]
MAAKRVVGLILVSALRASWWALVILLPLLGVWLGSSIAAYLNGPRWLAFAAGVLLFPVGPWVWERLAERRRARREKARADLRGKERILTRGDRWVLRTLALNALFLTVLAAWYPTQAFAALATRGDWFVEGSSGDFADGVRSFKLVAADGLEFLYDAAHDNPFRVGEEEGQFVEDPEAGQQLGSATPISSSSAAPEPDPQPSPAPSASGAPTPSPAPEPQPRPETTRQPRSREYPFPRTLHPLVNSIPASEEQSVQAVGNYIRAHEPDPFMRVKALHDYVADRIAYDGPSYVAGEYPPWDAPTVLRTRLAVCAGYAKLLEALGKVTGDKILYVTGDARVGNSPPSGNGHAWNVAQIEGAWYLLDPTWDSGSLSGATFKKQYSTDYLFAPPQVMGITHFPDDSKWQLRSPKISRAEFLDQPVLRPWFFNNRLTLLTPKRAQVTVRQRFGARIENPLGRFFLAYATPKRGGPEVQCDVSSGKEVDVSCQLPPGEYRVGLYVGIQQYNATYSSAAEFQVFSN